MSQVFFYSYSKGNNPLDNLEQLLLNAGFEKYIPRGKTVVIKLHMGELGNIRYIRPAFVYKVVEMIKKRGGKPFLFDTVSAYPAERSTKAKYIRTAARNGFSEATVGAPVIITDDNDALVTVPVVNRIENCHLSEVKIPEFLVKGAAVIVLSHVKGHELAGFGGALKNLAMGCVATKTKQAQHSVNKPEFNRESDCTGCADCVDTCPPGALSLVDGKPVRVDAECTSCGSCFFKCAENCWVWPRGAKEKLQVCLAHTASAIISTCHNNMFFVNFVQDVTPDCDCAAPSGRPVIQDVGILSSVDPVAIDKASLDLIDAAPIIPGSTTAKPPDLLGKMHNTSCLVQVKTAEKLNLGTSDYQLVSI